MKDEQSDEKQELQEVLKFPIEIFRSQFEIRTFISLNTLDYGTLINKEIRVHIKQFRCSLLKFT